MKISTERYPIDIIILLFWSLLIIPIILLNVNQLLQIFLGLPIILFIPGYILTLILFPTKKTDTGIDSIERFALSFALSLAIIPFIGLLLNLTPWGLELQPILLTLELVIFIGGIIATFRRYQQLPSQRFTISIELALPKDEDILDKILTVILVISIISFVALFYYVITIPKEVEPFTEFYILNSEGYINQYPSNLGFSEEAIVKIGIVNHEHTTKKYTVEVWLINQSTIYNETTNTNITEIYHMWQKFRTSVELNRIPADINKPWTPQWEYDYLFSINREGDYRLFFLLFTTETQEYQIDKDYKEIAQQKFKEAYSITNFSISIPFYPWISNIQAYPNSTLQNNSVEISCSVVDAEGVNNVILYIYDPDNIRQIIDITDSKIGSVYYYNQTYEKAGNYRYYIWANDTTDNSTTSPIYQFNITDVPIISDVWVSPTSTFKNGSINISSLIYDADGLKNVSLIITYPDNHIENISIINNRTGYIYYCNLTYYMTGNYSYYIWVEDLVGYTKISTVREFSVFPE